MLTVNSLRKKIFITAILIIGAAIFLRGSYHLSASAIPPNQAESEESPDLILKKADYYFQRRAYPLGEIPRRWQLKAIDQINKNQHFRAATANPITPIGPAPISGGATFGNRQNLTGRVTALAIDRQ